MQKDAAEAAASRSAYAYGDGGGERGAGGKMKRSFTRRQPSTPYDRPSTQDGRVGSQSSGGWISKLINPAYRLIAGGATRLLPSVFSDHCSLLPPPSHPSPANDDGGETVRAQETGSDDQNISVSCIKLKSDGAENQYGRKGDCEGHGFNKERRDNVLERSRATELSDIEKIIGQSTLCSEDIDRLTKIMHSRLVNVEQDQKHATSTSGKVDEANKTSEKPRMEDQGTPEDKGNPGSEFSTPLLQPTVQDDFCMSPVEIAKAFMTSRASKHETDRGGGILQNEKPSSHVGEMTSNWVLASSTPRSSIRWPGAMLQEENGYSTTPYSSRNTYGPIKHPRTPYSRAIYSESKSKLKPLGGESRKPCISYSTSSQKALPPYRQSQLTSVEDVHGSVGPIRSTRRKFASKSHIKESPLFWSSEKDSSIVKDWVHQDSPLPMKNLGHDPQHSRTLNIADSKGNTEVGTFTGMVHPHTSKLARDILDQISRPPTLKEKSDELKLVYDRRNSSDGNVASTMPNGATAISHAVKFSHDNEKGKGGLFKFPSQCTTVSSTTGAVSSASDAPLQKLSRLFDGVKSLTTALPDSHATPLRTNLQENGRNFQNEGNIPLPSKSLHNPSTIVSRQLVMHGGANRSGSKPKLPPISVEKSNTGVKFGFNHSNTSTPSFTFPTAAPSSSISEPPTPSVMPVSAIVDNTASPTFTFGDKKKSGPLVFAFPSSSTAVAALPDDEPIFKFGSDKSRVSFASIGKDEVCY